MFLTTSNLLSIGLFNESSLARNTPTANSIDSTDVLSEDSIVFDFENEKILIRDTLSTVGFGGPSAQLADSLEFEANVMVLDATKDYVIVRDDVQSLGNTDFYGDLHSKLSYESPSEKYVLVDGKCVARQYWNRFTQSANLEHSDWTQRNITITSGEDDPFGSTDGFLIQVTNTSSGTLAEIEQNPIIEFGSQTLSIYAKANTSNVLTFTTPSTSSDDIDFNLANGTITYSGDEGVGGMEDVSNGWYRCWFTFYADNLDLTSNVVIGIESTATANALHVYGPQINHGSLITYGETTTSVLQKLPIERYANGNVRGILLEEESTNIITNSNDFSDAAFLTNDAVLTENDSEGPNADLTGAAEINTSTAGGAGTNSKAYQSVTITDDGDWTFSVFLKEDTDQYVGLQTDGFGSNSNMMAKFDLDGGTIAYEEIADSAIMEEIGLGWYRCGLKFPADATGLSGNVSVIIADSANSSTSTTLDGTHSVKTWGWQLENQGWWSSYIPTTSGTPVTRTEDSLVMDTGNTNINSLEGTLIIEIEDLREYSQFRDIVSLRSSGNIHDLDESDIRIYTNTANSFNIRTRDSGTIDYLNVGGTITGGAQKLGFGWANNDIDMVLDGTILDSNTTATFTSQFDVLQIGGYAQGVRSINGHIKCLKYYTRKLSNTEIVTETT